MYMSELSQIVSMLPDGPRKFRERLEGWLDLVRALWAECPARIDENGNRTLGRPGQSRFDIRSVAADRPIQLEDRLGVAVEDAVRNTILSL